MSSAIRLNGIQRPLIALALMVGMYAIIFFLYQAIAVLDVRFSRTTFRAFYIGPRGAGLALCVWAAWGRQPVKQAALSALGFCWIFMVYYLGNALKLGRFGADSPDWILVPFWMAWWLAILFCVRAVAGVRLVQASGELTNSPWRYGLNEIFVFMALVGLTFGLARIIFPPAWENWEQGTHELTQNLLLNVDYYFDTVLFCSGVVPFAVAVIFRPRWAIAGFAATLFTALAAAAFQKWHHPLAIRQPLLAVSQQWAVELSSAAAHAMALLLVLRWLGYQLTQGHTAAANVGEGDEQATISARLGSGQG